MSVFVALFAGFAHGQAVDTTPLRAVQPLMEGWRFVQDDDLSDEQALTATAEDWEAVTLPHTWNAEDAANYESEGYKPGPGWYRLEFNTPAAGARHWLEIGAGRLVADVWLNGRKPKKWQPTRRPGIDTFVQSTRSRLASSLRLLRRGTNDPPCSG